MITRMLPVAEWPRLVGTEAETVWPHLNPGRSGIVVVEDAGAIVGCWVVMLVPHAECLWIAPSHRGKASVGRRLLRGLRAYARQLGVSSVATSALSEEVRGMLERIGAVPLDGDHFVMSMEEKNVCPQPLQFH